MKISETTGVVPVRKIIDSNWMYSIAWEIFGSMRADAKKPVRWNRVGVKINDSIDVIGAGRKKINENNRIALVRKMIDNSWLHTIAWENADTKSER